MVLQILVRKCEHLCSGTELECPLIPNLSFFNKLPFIFLKYLIRNQEYFKHIYILWSSKREFRHRAVAVVG